MAFKGRFGPIPVRTPGRFGPIPFRSGRFGPISVGGGGVVSAQFWWVISAQFIINSFLIVNFFLASPILFHALFIDN